MKASDLTVVPLSIRIHRAHLEIIERAAALVEGRTTSDYVREVLPALAAQDLDEELPVMPPITRGHHGSLEAQAAAKLGVSLKDFRKDAMRMAAAQVLGAEIVPSRRLIPAPPSPRRPAPRQSTPPASSPRPPRTSKHRG